MTEPFHYTNARVVFNGVELEATNVDLVVFERREDADAYQRLGEQIDAWNGVKEIPGDGYTRR